MKWHSSGIIVLLLVVAACGIGAPSETELAPLRCPPEAITGEYLVALHDSEDPESLAQETVENYGGKVHHVYISALKGFSVSLSDEAVEALRRHPAVRYIECNLEALPDPAGSTDIKGFITLLDTERQRIFVEGEVEEDTQYDAADVMITEETRIFEQVGERRRLVLFEALELRQRVEVRFAGPVLDSDPIQANASEVMIFQ